MYGLEETGVWSDWGETIIVQYVQSPVQVHQSKVNHIVYSAVQITLQSTINTMVESSAENVTEYSR